MELPYLCLMELQYIIVVLSGGHEGAENRFQVCPRRIVPFGTPLLFRILLGCSEPVEVCGCWSQNTLIREVIRYLKILCMSLPELFKQFSEAERKTMHLHKVILDLYLASLCWISIPKFMNCSTGADNMRLWTVLLVLTIWDFELFYWCWQYET